MKPRTINLIGDCVQLNNSLSLEGEGTVQLQGHTKSGRSYVINVSLCQWGLRDIACKIRLAFLGLRSDRQHSDVENMRVCKDDQ